MLDKMRVYRAVVVAQLVEWLPPTPEICDLNPVIGKFDLPSTVLKTVLKVVPRLWVMSFINKYKTSTTYPLYETT